MTDTPDDDEEPLDDGTTIQEHLDRCARILQMSNPGTTHRKAWESLAPGYLTGAGKVLRMLADGLLTVEDKTAQELIGALVHRTGDQLRAVQAEIQAHKRKRRH